MKDVKQNSDNSSNSQSSPIITTTNTTAPSSASSTGNTTPTLMRKNSLKGIIMKRRIQGSSFYGQKNTNMIIKSYKPLIECGPDEIEDILFKKIDQCNIIFDFVDTTSYLREKEIKRSILIELIDFLNEYPQYMTKKIYQPIFEMISFNLIRDLSPSEFSDLEIDEDMNVFDSSWPHLQFVYELFLLFLESSNLNIKACANCITLKFIHQILQLFDSEDIRERECLKTVLHRIYGKFLNYRNDIRKMMNNIFLTFIYETEKFNGIAELLEIYGSIINGFALPLKQEHIKFLINVLLPLHRVRYISIFHGQLSYCVIQFLEKNPALIDQTVDIIIKYWPRVSSQKEILFLGEIEDILELCDEQTMTLVGLKIFKVIARASNSEHFQVSERALCFWQNDYIIKNITPIRDEIINIVFPSLYMAAITHWNQTINSIALNVVGVVVQMNMQLCSNIAKEIKVDSKINTDENNGVNNKGIVEKLFNLNFE